METIIVHQTAARRCLQISEIQYLILEEIASEESSESLRTLSAWARTSKMVCELALNFLWRNQTCLGPLINCLPEDLISPKVTDPGNRYSMSFRRRLQRSDFIRFFFYSTRIIEIRNDFPGLARDHHLPTINAESFRLLARFVGGPLMPNLRFHGTFISSFEHTLYTMSPSITELRIDTDEICTPPSHAFYNYICIVCPNIKSLTIQGELGEAETNGFICSLFRLEDLDAAVQPMHPRTLLHIAALPYLKDSTILITNKSTAYLLPTYFAQPTFPCLTDLAVTFEEAIVCIRFMHLVRFEHLEYLDFAFQEELEPQEVGQISSAIASRVSHTSPRMLGFRCDLNTDCPPVPADALRPLRLFSNLESFTFFFLGSSLLDDAAFDELVRGWPQLTYIKICPSDPMWEHNPSQLTLRSLLSLAKHCPQLQLAHVYLDARDVDVDTEGVVNKSLESLALESSAVTDTRAVANFMLSIFPGLKDVRGKGDTWPEIHSLVTELNPPV